MAPYDDSFVRNASEGYFSQDEPNTFLPSTNDTPLQNDIPASERIFVNQSLDLGSVQCFGFDMDYTLCEYISPEFDQLGFNLAKQWLVDHKDYPKVIESIQYNPSFVVRGLWFDKVHGNLLKVDQFGNVLQAYHGFRKISQVEIESIYPDRMDWKDSKRVYIMNTPFNLPETFLVAALIDYYDQQTNFKQTDYGWNITDEENNVRCFTFQNLFQDIRESIDDIHLRSMSLKKTVLETPSLYIKKDPRLSPLLTGIKMSGRKSFLLTNSDWTYTNGIMTFLLGDEWHSFFDTVVVDACKPKYFSDGTPLKQIDRKTGDILEESTNSGRGDIVYSGGNYKHLTSMDTSSIMYCGDHLFADIIMCRKLTPWKTLLIIPELAQELSKSNDDFLRHLHKLEHLLATNPKLSECQSRLEEAVAEFDARFGEQGSLFRCGVEISFFAAMTHCWSEIYTGSVCNLINYSLDTKFVQPPISLPHE